MICYEGLWSCSGGWICISVFGDWSEKQEIVKLRGSLSLFLASLDFVFGLLF